ncbi:MAG: invasion associated locus B family protein [Beijerinckiaceae bacterium]|nr:invasion associated locus B family protein [Beijerinckiaceae bacterium]
MTRYFHKTVMIMIGIFFAAASEVAVAGGHNQVVAANPTQAAAPPPVSPEPRQTSAAFADWVTRCERVGTEPAVKTVCEVTQTLVVSGQQAPIAQIAFGHGDGVGGMGLTVLLPVNITLDKPPSLGIGEEEGRTVTLALKRCIPEGCFAESKIEPGTLVAFRNAQKPGKLTFTDAAGHSVALPLSFRGLAQALDQLDKHS